MRLRASVAIVLLFLILFGVFVVGAARTVSSHLVERERNGLVSLLPLVYQILATHPEALNDEITSVAKLAQVDITLIGADSVVEASSWGGGSLVGKTLTIANGGQAVFQVHELGGVSSFLLSAPLTVNGVEKTLVLSEPDETVGAFFDDFLTVGVVVLLLGVVGAVGTAWILSYYEHVFMQEIAEAFSKLADKTYSYRILDTVGGSYFSAARLNFNHAMEEFGKLNANTDQFVRSRLVSGEQDRRALVAALGSVGEGIFVIDALGKILIFNPKMEELSGIPSDTAIGKAMSDLVAISGPSGELSGLIPKIIATGAPEVFPSETKLKRRDGTFIPIKIKTIPVKAELRGTVTHVVAVVERGEGAPKAESKPALQTPMPPKPEVKPSAAPTQKVEVRSEIKSQQPSTPKLAPLPAAAPLPPAIKTEIKIEPNTPPTPISPSVPKIGVKPELPKPLPISPPPLREKTPEPPKKIEPMIIQPAPVPPTSPAAPSPAAPSIAAKPQTPIERVIAENAKGSLFEAAKKEDQAPLPPPNLPI